MERKISFQGKEFNQGMKQLIINLKEYIMIQKELKMARGLIGLLNKQLKV